jgi:tetratricopeptide (TPR) repeat protein
MHRPSIADRVHVDRVIRDRDSVLTAVGKEVATGGRVVIKELRGVTVRLLPPADPKRSVWTRLILPSEVEHTDGVVRILRPFIEGNPLDPGMISPRPSLEAILGIGVDVLRALDTLHGLGVVHGAIKPSNIIVTSDQRAWLVDPAPVDPFPEDRRAINVSLEGARYRSPEQAGVLNDPCDPRSDLYSFGAVLYGCLTGRPLHDAEDTGELLRAYLLEGSSSIRAAGVGAPRVLDEVIGRLLRKDPRDRYTTSAAVLQDLTELERRLDRGDRDPVFAIGLGDVRSTLTEPGLVGRTEELVLMNALLGLAARGRGTLVRLEAESGEGKTRILQEAALTAAQRGDRVFRAEAHELEAPRPFAMLERLAASILEAASEDHAFADHLARTLAPWASELHTVLPTLGPLVRAGGAGGHPSERRLQDSLAALFDALGTQQRAAVLLLDDCQWADELSLGVVGRWSAQPRPTRFVSVVAATRSEDADADRPGEGWTNGATIALGSLERDETRDLASSMAGRIPDEAHAVITRLSRGRPFFVTSVLRGMVESRALRPGPNGWVLDPDALATLTSSRHATTLVTRRLGRLSDETLGFLSGAAVLGRHASAAETATLAQADGEQIDVILEEARRAGLIWPTERRDGFSFIHDKVREGAIRRLNAADLRVLHLRAAGLIERTRPGDVFDIAYHYDQAGASDRALPAAIEAASLARARQALESAETMLRIAARGIRDGDLTMRARVAEDLGEILMRRGAYEESARWLAEARSMASAGDRAAAIEGKIGELAFKRGDVRTAAEAIERALRMIGRRVPRRPIVLLPLLIRELLVQMLHSLLPALFRGRRPLEEGTADLLASRFHGRLGYAWWFERGKIATLWTHFRSLNLAERYPPSPELAQAYSEHAPAMMLIPWHRRGLRYAQRSHAIHVQLGDLWGQGQSLHFWGAGLYAASAFGASLERMREALELLERTGDRWEINNCRLQIAMAMYRLGDLAGAVEASKAAQAGLEIGDAQARGIGLEAWAKATDGLVPERLIRSELERSSEDVLTVASVMQAEGVRLLGAGEPLAAVAVFEESQRLFRHAGMKNAGVSPVRPWLLTALRRTAETTHVVDRRRRTALLRRARSVARQAGRRARFYRNDLPHVLRERAHLAALGGRQRRAHTLFDRSLEVAMRQGAQAEALRTRISRGQVGRSLRWPAHVEDGARAERELADLVAAIGNGRSSGSAGPDSGRSEASLEPRETARPGAEVSPVPAFRTRGGG